LWIELDERVDTQRLNRLLEEHLVQIAIGSIFSASGKYRNCLRINFAQTLTAKTERAVQQVGLTISQMLENC